MSRARPVSKSVVIGALAGLVASYAMEQAQSAMSASSGGNGDPSTVKAAERLAGPIPKERKRTAGACVHYGFGAALGTLYGGLVEVWPTLAVGFGVPYGIAVFAVADEVAVPALGLSGPPWESPSSTHAYSLASHALFGAVLEGGRRLLRLAV